MNAGELVVTIQAVGDKPSQTYERLPVIVDPSLGCRYALVKFMVMGWPRYGVIAQVPGAAQWRVLDATLGQVKRVGFDLLARNGIEGELLGWDSHTGKHVRVMRKAARREA